MIVILILLSTSSCHETVKWPDYNYSKVKAYYYENNIGLKSIVKYGRIVPDKNNLQEKDVSQEQVKKLASALFANDETSFIAKCYIPRNAFVFYDEKGDIKGWLDICFECSNAVIEPKVNIDISPDYKALSDLFQELGLPTR